MWRRKESDLVVGVASWGSKFRPMTLPSPQEAASPAGALHLMVLFMKRF